jgi:small subunit ribosomal protein S9
MATAKYIEAVGRRKTATARVRITPASKGAGYTVNGKALADHFQLESLQQIATAPFADLEQAFEVSAKVQGGGINAQAEAVRHGVARALTEWDKELRGGLKKKGFLKRDPRAKERRKFGLKKARKRGQWSKR